MSDKLFVEGLFFRRPEEGTPDFIKGKLSIEAGKLIKFLEKCRPYLSDRGWLNVDLKESKGGNLYFEVNTWKPKKPEEQTADLQPIVEEKVASGDIPF